MVKGTSDHRPHQRSVIGMPFCATTMNARPPTAERHFATTREENKQGRGFYLIFKSPNATSSRRNSTLDQFAKRC
jgi:hypothetical protein